MSLEDHLARAIADAFWETAETPRHWATMSQQQREVFRICAQRAIEAGREYRKRHPSQTPLNAEEIPG